jgi:Right handed beta helix region
MCPPRPIRRLPKLFAPVLIAAAIGSMLLGGCGDSTTTTGRAAASDRDSGRCTATVSSLASAQAAVSSAAPGAVVCVGDGSYGKLTLDADADPEGVTVQAEHPGEATIAGASISGSHLTVARFVFSSGVQIQPGATAITIEHNRVTGGGQGIDAGPTTTTSIDDLAIVGNQLVGPFGEDAIHLNRYHDGDGDGVGILVEGNEITGVRENGAHTDCLQTVWVGDHLVFRRNYLHDNRCQGFFVKDQASLGGVSGPIHGIAVEDNLFLRNHEPCDPAAPGCGQPLYFQVSGPYTGFAMKRNTIWGDGADSIAAFRDGTGSDTVIADNIIYRLWTDTNMSAAGMRDNTICTLEAGPGGSWPSPRPGEVTACSLDFTDAANDDYRLAGGRGVDWAPAQQHYGP